MYLKLAYRKHYTHKMQKYQSVNPCQNQTKKTKEAKEQGSQSHSCQRWLVA